jgi:hypothetical protein
MKHIKRLLLILIALLLVATASFTAVIGIRVLMEPEVSAFSPIEAIGFLMFSAAAIGCIFLVQRVLKETYRDD